MLSTWWSNARHLPLQELDDSKPQLKDLDSTRHDSNSSFSRKSTSFRHQSLGKETRTTASLKKKKSKHKRSKSKQQVQPSDGASKKVSEKRKSIIRTSETSSIGTSEDVSTPRKFAGKEQCKVINLKIPLPSDITFRHSHFYSLQEEQEHLKAMVRVEESSPGTPRSRKKSCASSSVPAERDSSQQTSDKTATLKSIELVSFVTSDLPATDHYSEHQRILPKSKSLAAPALSTKYSSLFTSLIQQRPDSATNWRETPSPSLNHSSPTHHRRGLAQPTLESPDIAATSRRLPTFSTTSNSLATNSQPSMQDYIFRPVFRYYHQRNGSHYSSQKTCTCTNGCRLCLTSVQLPHPTPLILDYQHPQLQQRSRRNSLDGGRNQYVSSCVELPPLSAAASEEMEESESILHAQGRSVVRHFPRPIYRKPMKLSLCSPSMCTRPPVPSYPDALTNGPPGFHRRLSQMAILVSETVRWENEKTTKSKKKKSSSANNSNNSGSQGSL